jgi:hypothetical protein
MLTHSTELEAEFPARSLWHMITGKHGGELHIARRTFLACWLQIMEARYALSICLFYTVTTK